MLYHPSMRTDDVPIQITDPVYRPIGQGQLETWLNKEAEGGGVQPENNESVGTSAYDDLYNDPPGRKDVSNVDGNWGKREPTHNGNHIDPQHNNQGTYTAAQQERHAVTGRALDSLPLAERNARELLAKNLEHAASGNFTTHSVTVQGSSKESSVSERVRKLLSR